ncbi:hypothetical protein BGW42_006157 [Actinomortierella wolfii]|nr:hypothetical protein BGW41_005955 [Actinomortierella wolfii]KAG0223061.1 hypothetical protein BGW42_006157 [Actinomortierella wolfii]
MTIVHPSSSVLTPPQSPKSAATAMVDSFDAAATKGNATPLTHILALYQKATSAFLLRQLSVGFSTCLEAQELLLRTNQDYGLDRSDNLNTRRSYLVLKQKLWILHASIFGAMLSERHQAEQQGLGIHTTKGKKRLSGSSGKDNPEKLVKDLWRRLVEDYGGIEGDVDGQVVVPFVVLCINQKLLTLARQITEAYLSTMPEGLLIHLEAAAGALTTAADPKDPLMTTYERLVELYLIHVLAKLGEWDYARQFLSYNTIISSSSKKTYSKIIDKLHQKSLRPKKKAHTKPKVDNRQNGLSPELDNGSSAGGDASPGSPTLGSPASLSSESTGSSSAPSGMSTMTSSPVLRSDTSLSSDASIPSLSAGSAQGVVPGKATVSRPIKSRSVGNRSVVAATKGASSSTSSGSQLMTIQTKVWILLQHYVSLVRTAGTNMGPNQLMAVAALVLFIGALSRNRARVSQIIRTATGKLLQTVKMGTTVTSL